jgi:hypothetical protein
MSDNQRKAADILGPIDWQSDVHGLCHCPGEAAHTSHTRLRDTTVFIDGVPTIFCWHSSCVAYRDEANRKLRRAILGESGFQVAPMSGSTSGTNMTKLVIQKDPETEILDRLKTIAESNKQRYLTHYNWDPADMCEESPIRLDTPEEQYQAFLSLFHDADNIWIGDITDSGRHPQNFRLKEEWAKLSLPIGQFTTGAVFVPGTISRSNEKVDKRLYLVVESDTLTKPQMGAVFQLMRDLFRMKLYAVINTGGKSLHGWFEMPDKKEWENQLKAFLVPLGCDPATFKPSQPVRIPGAKRNENTQSLLWFCKEGK